MEQLSTFARLRLACLAGLLPLLGACQTTEIRSPIAATGEVKVGVPAQAWEVVHGERELAGLVILFEGARPSESIYVVRNAWHQDLGLIDNLGRAYRYLPHHKAPAWVGSGTVEQGVEHILALEDCQLVAMPFREINPATSPGDLERRRADHQEPLPGTARASESSSPVPGAEANPTEE